MPVIDITITLNYTTQQLDNAKKVWKNPDGTLPNNAQVLVNLEEDLKKYAREKYRRFMYEEQAAAIAVTDLDLT